MWNIIAHNDILRKSALIYVVAIHKPYVCIMVRNFVGCEKYPPHAHQQLATLWHMKYTINAKS